MNANSGTIVGSDGGVYLYIGDGTIALQCDVHPEFVESYRYGDDQRVPATWLVTALASHLKAHQDSDTDEQAAPAAETAAPLDTFGREVATLCRRAMGDNDGDPDDKWPSLYRIAVALVLGNHEYLRDMGPGPGYSPEQAALFLFQGMEHRPADLDAWIEAIRTAIRRPGPQEDLQDLRLPDSTLRAD